MLDALRADWVEGDSSIPPAAIPDLDLLGSVASLDLDDGERAEAMLAALDAALELGPPHMGRAIDRVVLSTRAGAIPPRALLSLGSLAGARPELQPRRAGLALVLAFLVLWSVDPADPRTAKAAARADAGTGGRWGFGLWGVRG